MSDFQNDKIVKYFGFGSNKDLDMMTHMVGRLDLKGEPGILFGYELCIQKTKNIRDIIPSYSPISISPREIIRKGFGDSFELYIARPQPDSVIKGTIWDLTVEELNLVKEWELVNYGMQEEVKAIASDLKGDIINVETQALIRPPVDVDRVIKEPDYPAYIVDKSKMLDVADRVRAEFLTRKK